MHARTIAAVLLAGTLLVGCAAADGAPAEAPPASRTPAASPVTCGMWLALGAEPTDAQLVDAARRYPVVVLNAWEVAAQKRLRQLNPAVTVLVYKDLSSTRSYPAARDGLMPSGVDPAANPDWFATDTSGQRIEWRPFPQHWQMTVWDTGYQRAWADDVSAETVRNGWDGVFADNDIADLSFYSNAVLAGTSGVDETNRRIRDGLDRLVTTAGTELEARGKLLVPNLSEARLFPGRWTEHSRFGGAMEENFAQYGDDGSLITWQGDQWDEMLRGATDGKHLTLLVTKTGDDRSRDGAAERAGFAGAALLSGDRTCWTASPTGDYSQPGWSGYQSLSLGAATGPARRDDDGVWTREFANGWVALNPTTTSATVTPPTGMRTPGGSPAGADVTVPGADAVILVR
ncbi:putative glycoside hydrolase family 15 protein [Pseudonocardia endophytica]|uniref:Putative glycosyl hydrolase-like family 15 (GHL15) protein n=1 Tax=Pseudonocardia endophytica TaxID=401976 RepID=A0A4R1HK58_PSEEN|nr:putative glycoside hydrolase family 15 protein [Pseudonocardia endophytica]TCK20895.1 putative glycosyl hydrolase-like family 15 (GHL15) protein [Pseudonocardia endophytica]